MALDQQALAALAQFASASNNDDSKPQPPHKTAVKSVAENDSSDSVLNPSEQEPSSELSAGTVTTPIKNQQIEQELSDSLKQAVAEELGLPSDLDLRQIDLNRDLDRLAVYSIVSQLESAFQVTLEDREISCAQTAQDLLELFKVALV